MKAVRAAETTTTFDDVYRSERPRLVRLAHLLTGSFAVAEELVQEAFISLRRHWDAVENPAGYTRTAVVNLARSNGRRRKLEQLHNDRATATPMPQLPPDIDETWQLIRNLAPDQRAVIVLRFYEDRSLAQIAADLERPLGTVKSLLHRALKQLEEQLR